MQSRRTAAFTSTDPMAAHSTSHAVYDRLPGRLGDQTSGVKLAPGCAVFSAGADEHARHFAQAGKIDGALILS